jgi:hypothetical protein
LTLHSTTDPEAGMVWDFPERPVVDPVDFVGDDSLLFQTTDQADGSHEIGIANPDGSTTMLDVGYTKALSADPTTGRVAVVSRLRPDSSTCSAVVDPALDDGAPLWESCDYLLGGFSPDGRYVVASDPTQDGEGPMSISVLDAGTGDLVADFQQPRGGRLVFPNGFAWETPESVVAVAREGSRTTIVRMEVDGTLEQATDTLDLAEYGDLPYYLGQDRRRAF